MTELRLVIVFAGALLSSASYGVYNIELCVVPLKEIVVEIARPLVANMQHMFVRGADKTGLNFEPKNPWYLFDAEAKIGRQNYSSASCKLIFSTVDLIEYEVRWKEMVDAYDKAAKIYKYNLALKNCQHVTREIIKQLGYDFPADLEF